MDAVSEGATTLLRAGVAGSDKAKAVPLQSKQELSAVSGTLMHVEYLEQ